MEVTDEMIEAYGKAWHAADERNPLVKGERRRAGLEAVLALINAPVQEAEKWPRAVDRDGDMWYQHFPGVWSMDVEECVEDVLTTQRLLDRYGPLKGEGSW